ncbi:hypothetical protein V8G54_020249 [Vigna mungo]|uniref:Uncharacterized protein n=1 Tax=Vigna mungo TaxID=3915 RepID=A0AAQ3RVR2_VIGMU
MASVAESPESETHPASDDYPKTNNPQIFNQTTPFIDYAAAQAQLYHRVFNDRVDSTIDAAKSRFAQIRSTSYAHFNQTLDSLDDLKSQYNAYEDLLFGKIKEGVLVAASHPLITCGAAAALGLVVLKRPRQVLYYNTLRLLVNEESMISRAHAEVKELRQSIQLLKAEGEKLENEAYKLSNRSLVRSSRSYCKEIDLDIIDGPIDHDEEGSNYSVSRSRPPRRYGSPPRVYDFGGRKMEILVFNGDDTYGWLVRVEHYFKLNSVSEDEKLDAMMVALEGQGLNWYQWWEEQTTVRSWEDFKTVTL